MGLQKGTKEFQKSELYKKWEAMPVVKRWYESFGDSLLTAGGYRRRLLLYCTSVDKDPEHLMILSPSEAQEELQGFLSSLEGKNQLSYLRHIEWSVKSFYRFNKKPLSDKITYRTRLNEEMEEDKEDEFIPPPEVMAKVLADSTRRTKAIIAILLFSGVRIGVLGSTDGQRGLRLQDIVDLEIAPDGKSFKFVKVPARIRVKKYLSKTSKRYYTFIGTDGVEYLGNYLRQRIESGEILTGEAPVVKSANTKLSKSPFTTTKIISSDVRRAFRSHALPSRPYVCRCAFAQSLAIGEGKGLITHGAAQFLMGHRVDQTSQYAIDAKELRPDLMENLREAYGRLEEIMMPKIPVDLDDRIKQGIEEKFSLQFAEDVLKEYGISSIRIPEIIDRERLKGKSRDEIKDALDKYKSSKDNAEVPKCQHCGSMLTHSKRFCGDCGQPVERKCSGCGAILNGKPFCEDCGRRA